MVEECSTPYTEQGKYPARIAVEEMPNCGKGRATELMFMHELVEVQAERRVKVVSCCLHSNDTPEEGCLGSGCDP